MKYDWDIRFFLAIFIICFCQLFFVSIFVLNFYRYSLQICPSYFEQYQSHTVSLSSDLFFSRKRKRKSNGSWSSVIYYVVFVLRGICVCACVCVCVYMRDSKTLNPKFRKGVLRVSFSSFPLLYLRRLELYYPWAYERVFYQFAIYLLTINNNCSPLCCRHSEFIYFVCVCVWIFGSLNPNFFSSLKCLNLIMVLLRFCCCCLLYVCCFVVAAELIITNTLTISIICTRVMFVSNKTEKSEKCSIRES